MEETETRGERTNRSKVKRLIERYDLEGEGDRLEQYWIGEGGEQKSLRDLVDYFNKRIVEAAMQQADMDVLEGEVDNTYRLLTDDDVSSGVHAEARNHLQTNGVDVDRLEQEFVSRQAIHTFLTNFRGIDYPNDETTPSDRIERRSAAVQRLKNRLTAVVEGSLRSLGRAGDITIGSVDVLVSVRVRCTDCDGYFDIGELLSRRGCDCVEASA